ncbi:hypothetical protein QFC24_006783 [Naganishia onofrii]|uniref:Uncharacterized protein n=1 Tax=Naganishia onofrii TaxID=1851511 RepID=A0ACC2WYP9_9TREE|nr:hypothetical protein QFC24_006783 [Naganishia onofrii]
MVLLKPDNGFLGNPFKTRQDVTNGLKGLLDPLAPHTSPGGALITLGSSGTHYDLKACQLEAFARPLWGLVSLLAGGGEYERTETWRRGLASGTDPESEEYWGASKGKDQRMVETSPIGFALVMAHEQLFDPLDDRSKKNIAEWLGAINDKPMPDTNWLWFRVFANLALSRISPDEHYNPTRMKADLDHLDTFQLRGEDSGWSRDGPEGVLQLDYYSGSFAIQFAQMAYSKLMQKEDPERCENYRKRALRFALDLLYYFDDEGRCIPFGRSMIYRFAVVATFSILPFAFEDLPEDYPLKWGHVKGLVLRHLRWWGTQQDIFKSDGTLNIGYCYENMTMTENYNGFGSPYWCCKAFACLAVPESHPFWQADELPWPTDLFPAVTSLPDPLHIMVRLPPSSPALATHTYLLSSGQACHYALKASESKYGRYAYSSAFGFSCPTGAFGLEQMAADCMLALCDDPEEDGFGQGERWRVRRLAEDAKLVHYGDSSDQVYLHSIWRPWKNLVSVETWLLPPTAAAPDWYIRIHKIVTDRELRSSEGGWPCYGQGPDGRALVQVFSGEKGQGGLEESGIVRAITSAGIVGLKDLSSTPRQGKLIQSDANSNLIFSRSVLPSLLGKHQSGSEEFLVTAVFGQPAKVGESTVDDAWKDEWEKRPVLPQTLKGVLPEELKHLFG